VNYPYQAIPSHWRFGQELTFSHVGWAALAVLAGAVEGIAVTIDWKLGLLLAIGLAVVFVVAGRPQLILPVAALTVFLEGVTFSGQPITRLLAPAMVVVILAELLRGTARLRFAPPLLWVGAYAVWALSSVVWTASSEGTHFMIQSLGIALVFMLAFATLLESEKGLRRLLYVMAVAAASLGALSVLAFRSGLQLPYLSLAEEGRSHGGVGDPDFFAAMQLVIVPLVLVIASETKKRRLSLALYACLVPILASIFTSLSRGAFLGVAVLGVLFLVTRPEKLFRTRRQKAAVLIVAAIGLAFFFSRPLVREEVVNRATTIYSPKTRSDFTGSGRTELWKAATKTMNEHPVTGIGYGSFAYISERLLLQTPGVDPDVFEARKKGQNLVAHNTYLGTAAELGLMGLFLYLGIMISTVITLRRTAARAFAVGADFVGHVAYALVLGLAAWAVTDFFLSGETARTFWIIVGLTLALPKLLPDPAQPRQH
jgi:O-antigen ligase